MNLSSILKIFEMHSYENYQNKIKIFLLPKDEADLKNAIIEIRAGTGGSEATLFAYDLFRTVSYTHLRAHET